MNDITKALLLLAGMVLVVLVTNRHFRRFDHTDLFGIWLKGSGKLLRDYDAERKQIDEYMK